jgi:hypothetical protein
MVKHARLNTKTRNEVMGIMSISPNKVSGFEITPQCEAHRCDTAHNSASYLKIELMQI